MKYIKDDVGNLYETYSTPEAAINAYAEGCLEGGERVNVDTECSFAVAVDENGEYSFGVEDVCRFTNCTIANIKEWKHWYEKDWIEKVVWEDEIPEDEYEYYENYLSLEHVDAENIADIRNSSGEQLFEKIMNLVPAGKTPEQNLLRDLTEASVQCDICNDCVCVRWITRWTYEEGVCTNIEIYDVPTELNSAIS